MRAAVIRSFGGPDVIEIAEVPIPTPGPGQVLIRVSAATVNPVDLATRAGQLASAGLMVPEFPIGLGWDVAGVVDSGSGFQPGDHVIGLSDRLDVPLGTYADYVVLDTSAVALAPPELSAIEAATLPLNGLTALQALDLANPPEGGTLLVTGAAGAVGGFAVELAVQRGLRVAAVARPQDEALMHSLGASWFIPSTAPLAPTVRSLIPGGADAALDTALTGIPTLNAVRNKGTFIAVAANAAPTPLRAITVKNIWINANTHQLTQLTALTPRIADTLPLTKAALAHERLATGGLRGRLVLTPE
jgi:NADPH:quinone reductase